MIRTAILAGILLVMLSMAYSRPGALPSFAAHAPAAAAEEQSVEAEETAAPPMRHVEPPRAVPVAVAAQEESAALSAPVEEEVAEAAPEPAVTQAPLAPPSAVPPLPATELGRPISLLPQTASMAPARIEPLVSDDMPAPPAPVLPPVQEAAAPAPLPETYVATRPVNVPQDLASRMTPDGKIAPVTEARAPMVAAAGTKFMTPQERSRELYKLAREMEDTFIQNMTK